MSESTVPAGWRDASREELDRHWRAGSLSPAEHERRTTAVRTATTTAQLEEALAGLPPLPGQDGMLPLGEAASAPTPSASTPSTPSVPGMTESAGRSRGLPAHFREALIILAVFAAILLTSATHQWAWWLLVPLVAVLAQGASGAASRERRRERRREIHRYRRGE